MSVFVGNFSRDDLPEEGWGEYRKRVHTRAMRIEGSFSVSTREGWLTCEDGYLAIDVHGWPYPIARDEFEAIYERVT